MAKRERYSEDPLERVAQLERRRDVAMRKEQEAELVTLYHLWMFLREVAAGKVRRSRIPTSTKYVNYRRAYQTAADAIQYLIQDYPESETKRRVVRELFR